MLTARHRIFLALALVLTAAAGARAQSEQSKAEDHFVTQKMFQNRVFDVRNRDPQSLARVLSPLTSGFRGAVVSPNQEFRTISVRDFPENIAVIEEAIRRLDTPEAVRPAIEFRVHMLVASVDESVQNRYPAELSDLIRQLQSSLGYKNFSLMGSQVVRAREGHGTISNKGVADLRLAGDSPTGRSPVQYNYGINMVSLESAGGQPRIQVGDFTMNMMMPVAAGGEKVIHEQVGFRNPVSLRDGERVVVGTTSVGDKNVVVVLSATTVK
jgi:hypothetical protein